MAQLVDTLITRYTLDPSGYKKGADEVKRSSRDTEKAIKGMKDAASGMRSAFDSFSSSVSGLRSIVGGLLSNLARFSALAAAGLIGLAGYAVNAAVEMDTLERRLLGVTGSAEKAAELMSMIKRIAAESMFETAPVAEATIMLEAFGISAQKWTSLAVTMGTAFGGTADKLADFVAILGRLKGGQVSEALGPEGLGRFGISKDVLRQFGAVFDKSGAFVGSAEEAMAIIERVVTTKFGAIARSMESGPMAKWASFMDSLKFAAASAGKVILSALLPVLENVTRVITNLADGGHFERIAAAFMSLFNIDAAQGPLGKGMLWLEDLIKSLPERIIAFYNTAGNAFEQLGKFIRQFVIFALIGFGVQIVGALIRFVRFLYEVGKALKAIIPLIRAYATAQGIANVVATGGAAALSIAAGLAVLGASMYGAYALLDNALPEVPDFQERTLREPPRMGEPSKAPKFEPLKPGQSGSSGNPVQQALNQIAGNTGATASNTQKQLDMQRYVLGGGDLGRLGVTPVEMSARQGREVRIKVDSGAATLDDWVQGLINKAVRELKRRGQL